MGRHYILSDEFKKRSEVIEEAIQIGLETMARRNGMKSVQKGAQNGARQEMLPLES